MGPMIGKKVTVVVDRPLGTSHPSHPEMVYPVNYGYVPGVMAGDGEEQDAYLLGIDVPMAMFTGTVVAVIHRLDDVETATSIAAAVIAGIGVGAFEDFSVISQFISREHTFCPDNDNVRIYERQ